MPILDNVRTTVKNDLQLRIKKYSKKSIAGPVFYLWKLILLQTSQQKYEQCYGVSYGNHKSICS